jgi:hypothetical protein
MPKVTLYFNNKTVLVDFPSYLERKLLDSSTFTRWKSTSSFLKQQHGLWSNDPMLTNQGMKYVYEIPNNRQMQKLTKLFKKHNNRQVVLGVLKRRSLKLFRAMGWVE